MSVLQGLRNYHALLVFAVILAYLTGEAGAVHLWLGYVVIAIILFRLLWGLVGPRQIGIAYLFPKFSALTGKFSLASPVVSKILLTGIIVCLFAVSGTGIALDRADSPASDNRQVTAELNVGDDGDEGQGEGMLEELHEGSANLLFIFVGLHVVYLLVYRRKMAVFMLFLNQYMPTASTK